VLCEQLAKHYNTVFVPEFARAYLNSIDRKYTFEDVLFIAEQQQLSENKLDNQANKFLFCDTNLITIKIWLQVVFNNVPNQIEEGLKHLNYDFYLITDIDMPWEPDPLREHPNMRKELFEMHIEELKKIRAPYAIVSGLSQTRLQNAVSILENTSDLQLR
jgi:nicotinamide riboside kinase